MPERVSARRRPLRGMAVAVAGVLAVALAGCSGIPTSGPVHTAAGVVLAQDGPVTQVVAQPPRHGADPLHIVQGFMFASASFDDDHQVAREYLSPEVSKTWNPAAGTQIYQIDPNVGGYKQAGAEVTLTADKLGEISPQGEYTDAPSNATLLVTFKLRRVGGEWRITNPPPGLLLTAADRDRNYHTFDVYFPDPTSQVLVPDPILVPIGPGTAIALVRALLAGPTPWLLPAVRNAVPTGTKLVVESVPISLGIVQVNLTAASAGLPDPQTMSAQFVWTLRQLHSIGVNGVSITVGGIPLHIPGVPQTQPWDSWLQYDPDNQIPSPDPAAVYADDKGIALLSADRGRSLPGVLGDGTLLLHRPGISFDERTVAGLDAAARRLFIAPITSSSKPIAATITGASHLTAPSWDRFGLVWTVDSRPTGPVVWADQPGSAPRRVATSSDLPAGNVLALRIARDGVRAVLVIQKPGESTAGVYLARVVSRGDAQMALTGFRPLSTPLADVSDISWASADQLVVLGSQTAGGQQEPLIVDVSGGSVTSLGPIPSSSESAPVIVSVTSAPNQEILVSTSDDHLYRYVAVGWAQLGGGSYPSYPG